MFFLPFQIARLTDAENARQKFPPEVDWRNSKRPLRQPAFLLTKSRHYLMTVSHVTGRKRMAIPQRTREALALDITF